MKRIDIFFIAFLVLFIAGNAFGQTVRKGKYAQRPERKSEFLKTQWWLGFYTGANVTKAIPGQQYSGIVALNYDNALNEKSYDDYSIPGGQAGINVTFYHHGFSFTLAPHYRVEQFAYSNTYLWESDENQLNSLTMKFEQEHKLQFVEVPLMIRYDVLSGQLRPFVQAGAFYRHLLDARKTISASGTDLASGSAGPFENEEISLGAKDLFVSSTYGILGGIGCTYDIWNVRFTLDVTYRQGLNNISNAENRYNENPVTGIGDAMDDIKLNSVSVNLGCVFPLRFISKNLKAIE